MICIPGLSARGLFIEKIFSVITKKLKFSCKLPINNIDVSDFMDFQGGFQFDKEV